MNVPQIVVDSVDDVRAVIAAAPPGLHEIGLREIVSGVGSRSEVGEILRRLGASGPVVVLTDAVAKKTSTGEVLDEVLAGMAAQVETRIVVVGDSGKVVHADETTLDAATLAVKGAAILVTVGSGTMADIGKVVATRLALTHVVVQTAASVNGFADDQSVLLVNGAKRTTPSGWPDALVIDPDVLAHAPAAMNRSGLGDQLSMFTAAADWYLASAAGFDVSYSPAALAILRGGAEGLLERASEIGAGEPDAVAALAHALTRGGLAMGAAGRTSPSSGTEHTISHLLEMHAGAHGYPAASHGSQVGVAGVVAATIWERVRGALVRGAQVRPLPVEVMHERVLQAFEGLGEATAVECWTAYERKLRWINDHIDDLQRLCDTWAAHDEVVGSLLVDGETIAGTLRKASAPARFADLTSAPDDDTVRWAVRNAHLMRDRFIVLDLAEVTGLWDDAAADAVLALPPGEQS